ncbi:hypothetical protein Ocin01_17801 [Orchesella cincta]|uniref:Uncharacterized protein n=1 Tax=Orchesella cincta TaxID=48709 RepID=A0A1D2M7H8_ORCCI|nr:hypothetical protein Ocin01_17801 [Orchesella cincta]
MAALPKYLKKVLVPVLLITLQTSCIAATAITTTTREEDMKGSNEIIVATAAATPLQQINCTGHPTICNDVCNEPQGSIPYSSTFCDSSSGSCVCDCRDSLRKGL